MPNKKKSDLVIEVEFCRNCPFARWNPSLKLNCRLDDDVVCSLAPEPPDACPLRVTMYVGQLLESAIGTPEPPDACPLRVTQVLVKLRRQGEQ